MKADTCPFRKLSASHRIGDLPANGDEPNRIPMSTTINLSQEPSTAALPLAPLSPADIETYLNELPIATAVLPRLQTLLLNEEVSLREIVDLVLLDPGLAARVMQAASAPVNGRASPVNSLHEALARIGTRGAYRVTAAFAMRKFMNAPLHTYGLGPREFWRRSLACALVMADLAPAADQDEKVAYTVGLLHALGMVFIDRHVRQQNADKHAMFKGAHGATNRHETEITGLHQAQVAALVLRTWNFGDAVVEPIENLFTPHQAGDHRKMTALLVEAREMAIEIVETMPQSGPAPTDLLALFEGDDWKASIATQILAIEG